MDTSEDMRRWMRLLEAQQPDDSEEETDLDALERDKTHSDTKHQELMAWHQSEYRQWQDHSSSLAHQLGQDEFMAPYPMTIVRKDPGGEQHNVEIIATIKGRLADDEHWHQYDYLGMMDAFIVGDTDEPPLTSREMKWIATEIGEDETVIQEMLDDEYCASHTDDIWRWKRHWMDPRRQ